MSFRAKLASRTFAGLAILLIALLFRSPVMASTSRQEGYPPPGPESGGVPSVDSAQATATPAAYPPVGTDLNMLTPVPIGGQNEGQLLGSNLGGDTGLARQAPAEGDSRGLVFLWLGFIATFLIFLISVVGSVLLFTRRNES